MQKVYLLIILAITLNSCATLLNHKTTKISISSDIDSNIIYNSDTLSIGKLPIKITPKRSKDSLSIIVFKDEYKNRFSLKSKNALAFYANIPCNYGLGMLIDLTNDKRYVYKKNIHFVWDSLGNSFSLSYNKIASIQKGTVFLYTAPLNAIDVLSTPMLTIGTEYFILDDISLSAAFGTKYFERLRDNSNIEIIKDKGYSFRFEPKLYNKINLTGNANLNEYLGLELRVINNNYNDSISYFEDESNPDPNEPRELIIDDFARMKTVSVINLKYGIHVPAGKRLYFDFYTGFGIRFKKVTNSELEFDNSIHNLREDDNNHFNFFPEEGLERVNKDQDFNFSLGFKFGIKL